MLGLFEQGNNLDNRLGFFNDPPEGEDTLLVSDAGALDHDEVLLDLSVVGEPAHGVDGLVSQVVPENNFGLNKSKINSYYIRHKDKDKRS